MPGDLEGSPALTFMPLDPAGHTRGRHDSLRAMMARRFDAYKTHVVKPFFHDHFARLERQIVLVDALGALNAGPAALADLERALSSILTCFRPGANSWLSPILGKRIDRLLKKYAGQPFHPYLAGLRIAVAKERLRSSNANEATVAELCGFRNVEEMERMFLKYSRTTPYKFRLEQQVT